MMQKVIVTGGLGFIGSHLVETLLEKGYTVVVIDNLSTGRHSNLNAVLHHPRLTVIEEDIRKPEKIREYFKDCTYLFHLAALADIVPSIEEPVKYYESNVTGTLNILELARAFGVKKIIYAASSSCYGFAEKFPTSEGEPAKPQYPYALTKYLGEQILLHWGQVYKMNWVSLRLFNVFGPRQRTTGTYGAVLSVFLAQKLADKPLTIVGDGTQTRDFTFVTDVANAFLSAAQSDIQNEIFNVGSGNTYSINHLANLIGGEKIFIPKRPGEPDCTFADTKKIKKILGWEPKIKFEEGVQKTLEQIRLWSDAPVWTPASIEKATKNWFRHLSSQRQ